ncbi:MAG: cytochrome c biogenesis protein ResB [Deltaproteobacteria bacterium]|nr:cytochrome c biogenesis protein ResB [Deltaproteobacteria bacterium]
MKKLWFFFSSVRLTIALAALICMNAAWGSVLTMRYPRFYRGLDGQILLPWLLKDGPSYAGLTLWIYILVFLVFLFAVNTAVCTADKVYSIAKAKRPVRAFFPHIVHIGFFIALLGHLAGSAWGFKTYGHTVSKGSSITVPGEEGLELRLDNFEMRQTQTGDLEYLRSTVTLTREGREVLTDGIEINGPLLYKGLAFYHLDQGYSPEGVIIDTGKGEAEVRLGGSFTAPGGARYRLGDIFPDFAVDERGQAYSRSGSYRNPHIELIPEGGGKTAYLDVSGPGAVSVVNGAAITMKDYMMTPYVVLSINKDPGIWFIITGSSILVAGMVLLLFFRGERSELVRRDIET